MTDIDWTAIEEGEELRITYKPTTGKREERQTLVAEVENVVEQRSIEGFEFATLDLAVYRDDNDTIPRRRLKIQASDPTLMCRRTTPKGAVWQRMSRITACEVDRA